MINLYDSSGTLKLNIRENRSCKRVFKLMEEDYISLKFVKATSVFIEIGDYVEILECGVTKKFVAIEKFTPTRNITNRGYDYDIKLEADYMVWKNKVMKYRPTSNNAESSFSVTDSITAHGALLKANIDELGEEYNIWYSPALSSQMKNIVYQSTSIYDAMIAIAETFECECWVGLVDGEKCVCFGYCEGSNTPDELELGVNVRDMSQDNPNGEYATRVYPFGGETNIPYGYRKKLEFYIASVDSTNHNITLDRDVLAKMFTGDKDYPSSQTLTISDTESEEIEGRDSFTPVHNGNVRFDHSISIIAGKYAINEGISVKIEAFTKGYPYYTRTSAHLEGTVGLYLVRNTGSGLAYNLIEEKFLSGNNVAKLEWTFSTNIPEKTLLDDYIGFCVWFSGVSESIADVGANNVVRCSVVGNSEVEFTSNSYSIETETNLGTVVVNPLFYSDSAPQSHIIHLETWNNPQEGDKVTFNSPISAMIPSGWYIDDDYDENVIYTGRVGKNLMLPIVANPVISDGIKRTSQYVQDNSVNDDDVIELVAIFDNVIPSFVIDEYTVDARNVERQYEGTEDTYIGKQFILQIPAFNNFDTQFVIGDSLKAMFVGESKLSGMEFEIKYIGSKNGKGEFAIMWNEDYGRELPDFATESYPDDNDPFIMLGVDVSFQSPSIIASAESDLATKAVAYLKELLKNRKTYTVTPYASEVDNIFPIGHKVTLINDAFFSTSFTSRVYGYEYIVNKPQAGFVYYIGENTKYSKFKVLESKVDSLNKTGESYPTGTIGNQTVKIIKLTDDTEWSDMNVLSSKRAKNEFVSRLHDDTKEGNLDINGILEVLNNIRSYQNIEAMWGVAAHGMASLEMNGGGVGTITGINFAGSPEQIYTPSNGLITLPDYPSLDGYATENYVAQYFSNNFTRLNIKNTLGISDWALAAYKPSYNFSEIGSKPTTLAGYGITDAHITSGVITLGGNAITPATLTNGKIPLSQIPDAILGQLIYGGTVNGSGVVTLSQNAKDKWGITSLTLTSTNYSTYEGAFFIASADATSGVPSTLGLLVGDWVVATASGWGKIDNTDAVTGVKGDAESTYRIGNVNITKGNIGLGNVENTALSTWAGTTNITTLGTITTGVWQGTAITDTYIASSGTWNTIAGYFSNGVIGSTHIPTAASNVKGGVKVGTGLSISNEVLSVKIQDVLTSSATDEALSAKQGKALKDLHDTLKTGLTSKGAHNLPIYLNASAQAVAIDALSVPGNIESTNGGVSANGICDLSLGGIGGGGDVTSIQFDEDVAYAENTPYTSSNGLVSLPSYSWNNIQSKPTTISGYAITDAYTKTEVDTALSGKQDTISDLSTIRSRADEGHTAYGWGNHANAGYLLASTAASTYLPLSGGTMSNTNLVENLNAEYLGGTKKADLFSAFENDNEQVSATIGGTNKKLTVDYATKALRMKQESKPNQEFIFRSSPKTIDTDSMRLDRIKGKTLVWNQLLQIPTFQTQTINDLTITNNGDGSITLSGTPTARVELSLGVSVNVISGHKYLVNSPLYKESFHISWSIDPQLVGKQIVTASSDASTQARFDTTDYNNVEWSGTFYLYCIDLTLMFGEGNEPTTVEEFEALFSLPYYDYNAGTLISNAASGLETVGFNLWDEEWEVGDISSTTGANVTYSNCIRAKNLNPCLAGSTIYVRVGDNRSGRLFWYDGEKNFIGKTDMTIGNSYIVPNGVVYFRFAMFDDSGSTYLNDICINLSDTAKNGTYEPYKKTITDLNLQEIRVKSPNIWDEEWENGDIDASGVKTDNSNYYRTKNFIPVESESYYFNTPYLYVFFYDANKNFIRVNAYASGDTLLASIIASEGVAYIMFVNRFASSYANDICINKSNSAFNGRYFPHGVITFNGLKSAGSVYDEISSDGRRLIRRVGTRAYQSSDSSSSTVITDGTNTNYPLTNVETYDLVEPIPTSLPSGTTERRLPEDTADSVIAPFSADITYGVNNGDILADLSHDRAIINYHSELFNEHLTGHKLLSNGIEVVNLSDSQALTNKTYNELTLTSASTGFTIAGGTTSKTLTVNKDITLNDAAGYAVCDSTSASAISTNAKLVTERDVYYGLPNINGNHTYNSGNDIFAPTTTGTAGYTLVSAGDGAPVWSSLIFQDTANQRVGIGISPSYKLHVAGDIYANGSIYTASDMLAGGNVVADAGVAAGGIVDLALTGDYLPTSGGSISGSLSIGTTNSYAKLQVEGNFYIDTDYSTTSYPSIVMNKGGDRFAIGPSASANYNTSFGSATYSNGTWVWGTEQVTLAYNGDVGIGATSPSYKLHVAGGVGATSYSNTSDARLKDNIQDMGLDYAKNIIMSARPVTFDWNKKAEELTLTGSCIGLIAQETEKYFPFAVSGDGDNYKGIDYTRFITPLIKVSQSHEDRIKELEAQILALTTELNTLKQNN